MRSRPGGSVCLGSIGYRQATEFLLSPLPTAPSHAEDGQPAAAAPRSDTFAPHFELFFSKFCTARLPPPSLPHPRVISARSVHALALVRFIRADNKSHPLPPEPRSGEPQLRHRANEVVPARE